MERKPEQPICGLAVVSHETGNFNRRTALKVRPQLDQKIMLIISSKLEGGRD
jgi:hypothetical protein